MKRLFIAVALLLAGALCVPAQDAATLAAVEDKLQKLRTEIEDIQFRLKKNEDEMEAIRRDMQNVRGGASAEQIQALEARIAAVDAARQRDKQAIIDQLAKELAGLGTGTKPAVAPAASGREHIVKKGESLSSIARLHGVSVADLRKANNLSSDNLSVDQKLVLPK